MLKSKVNVAIVGLGFGVQFIPIYKRHPNATMYAICRRSKAALDAVGDAFGVERRYTRFEDVLADAPLVDELVADREHGRRRRGQLVEE